MTLNKEPEVYSLLKILLVTNGIQQKSGTYTVLKNICPKLLENHEVTILTNQGDVDIACTKLIQLDAKLLPFPQYFYQPKLKNLLKSGVLNDYDIIHIFEYPLFAADYLTIKKKLFLPPLIISSHGSIHQFNSFPYNFMKKIHNKIMFRFIDNISMLIASTNAEKDHLIKCGFPKNKIPVLPLGIDLPKLVRVPSKRPKLLYVGRLTVTKNVDLLVKASFLCKRKDFELIIAGQDFGMLKTLKKLVHKFKMEDRVTFKGQVSESEKLKLFSEATIFVHPSLEDIFSLSLIEAAGVGIPSIAFGVEANPEIFENNCGLIVKGHNAKSLANSIDHLLNNEDERNQISKNAVISINQKYNWNNTVKKLEEYYLKLKTTNQ
jgi:glycosyltransferase involved in cell wall biosynthesis